MAITFRTKNLSQSRSFRSFSNQISQNIWGQIYVTKMGGTPSHHPSSRGVSIINHPTVGVPLITFLQFLLSKMGWKSPGPLGNQQSYPSRFLKLRVWSVWYRMHSVNFFEPMELGSGTPKNIRLHTKSSLIKKF